MLSATAALSPLSLHDALPICLDRQVVRGTGPVGLVFGEGLVTERSSPLEREEDHVRALVLQDLEEHHREAVDRSEEHTSELQSHHDLVCRLLLEKKNKR